MSDNPQPSAGYEPDTKGIIIPICPRCRMTLTLRRLRYDFPDGVIVETLFCANTTLANCDLCKGKGCNTCLCRFAIGAQIVGVEAPKSRAK